MSLRLRMARFGTNASILHATLLSPTRGPRGSRSSRTSIADRLCKREPKSPLDAASSRRPAVRGTQPYGAGGQVANDAGS